MTVTIAERVAVGATFLDQNDPGWWRADVERAIDLDRLNLRRGVDCVLGQRCPVPDPKPCGFVAYAAILTGLPAKTGSDLDALWEWGTSLGFTAPLWTPDMNMTHDGLTIEWKRVITERRQAS